MNLDAVGDDTYQLPSFPHLKLPVEAEATSDRKRFTNRRTKRNPPNHHVPVLGNDASTTAEGCSTKRLRSSATVLKGASNASSLTSRVAPTTNTTLASRFGRVGESGPGKTHPITAAAALKMFSSELSAFEQSEILEVQHVYFMGKTNKKVKGIPQTSHNNGYDDDRGDYRIVPRDHIGYRFEILEILGKGSFGQVVKVLDHKTGSFQALKIIRNKKRFHRQALVEVRILEFCSNHDSENKNCIIRMKESFYFREHLCITFELLSINLYEFIKSTNFRGVSLNLIRRFSIQMLTCLKFLRRNGIVHCDLKPENVLLKSANKSDIKVIDFGSSCFENERVYTYIQSRFYRSPEVILGNSYSMSIDMWSFACILVELYTGHPLFPGENEAEQMLAIMEVCGVPPKHIIETAPRRKFFFDSSGKPRITANSKGMVRRPASKDLSSATRCSDKRFIEFLSGCLLWDPRKRLSPEQALEHCWISNANKHSNSTSTRTSTKTRNNSKKSSVWSRDSKQLCFPPINELGPGHDAAEQSVNYRRQRQRNHHNHQRTRARR